MLKPESNTTRHRIDIGLGYASFTAQGEQQFIDRCLDLWYRELKRLYEPPRDMVEGDLYAGT
jgi:hypothetical protein